MSETTLLKILDGLLTLAQAGLQYQAVLAQVRAHVAAGASADEVARMLRDGRIRSEIEAQAAIDAAGKA